MKTQKMNDDDVDLLRIVSWNINGLRGNHAEIVNTLLALRADVICVQEAPRSRFTWPKFVELIAAAGFKVAAGDRRTSGLAILVGQDINLDGITVAPLVKMRRHRRFFIWPEYPRAILSIHFPFEDGVLVVTNMHLGLDPNHRIEHANRLLDLVDAFRRPSVVVGDLNEDPSGAVWTMLSTLLDDAGLGVPRGATFPASKPTKRIDSIHTSPDVEVLDYLVVKGIDGVPISEMSDHLPIIADVTIRRVTRGSEASILAEASRVLGRAHDTLELEALAALDESNHPSALENRPDLRWAPRAEGRGNDSFTNAGSGSTAKHARENPIEFPDELPPHFSPRSRREAEPEH